MMYKKIILIGDKFQAKEYLKKRDKLKGFLPITFDFESEELLLKNNIKFKTEEDYETETIYNGVYGLSLKNTKEICEKIKIEYRGIDLFQLFYMDLFKFLVFSRRFLRLLKQIKKREKIKEIIIFENICNLKPNEQICSKIAKGLFKKIISKEYSIKSKKHNRIVKSAGFLQKVFSRFKLSLLDKECNKIFFDDSKTRFEPILKELLKNKKNKLFRTHSNLQKSFFVGKRYIPFYEISQKKSRHQNNLLKDIKKFKKKEKFYFFDKIGIEKELKSLLLNWIFFYISNKFIEISRVINHLINLMGNEKIDLILLYADSETFEKTFAQVARLFNIPTIVILHGLPGRGMGPSFVPLSSDYIFVYGSGSEKRLNKLGINKEKIIITGSQQFDGYFNKDKAGGTK